ncbi:glycoside hydrolase family 97 catalytic domain-containing protein [Reichenbachiella sp. MALMAid0571]|uniref:glycoside hydrolase family 97 protein n=1 Tax=Reichenbachiella sp. MALMAid0571 TaxID=3143939 RepID=UPI0032DF0682
MLEGCSAPEDIPVLNSPDNKVQIILSENDGVIQYSVFWNEKEIIQNSSISILPDAKIVNATVTSVDQSWRPVWGQFSEINDQYNEINLTVDFDGVKGNLLCRAYDDGIAFRFVIPENPNLSKVVLKCDYNLSNQNKVYYSAGEDEPIGPISIEDITTQIKLPVIVETREDKYMAILESDLYSAMGFDLVNIKTNNETGVLYSENVASNINDDIITPWKVVLLGETAGDLVVNTVSVNLAAPCKLDNPSWVKPGKALWDWRVHGYTAKDGFIYGINTDSYLRFIDFASKNKIEYLLIDDAWYSDVDKGKIEHSDKIDLDKVNQYAKESGVDLILYYDRRKGDFGDNDLFKHYKDLGMKGIKYGFMGENVSFTREAIRLSAESKLLIDFHDSPVPMTGVRRTFPNAITREYCHAQQDSRRVFTPEAFIKMALINAVQGPIDMNNGNFDISGINSGQRQKAPKILGSYLTTVVAEAARTLIVFSGLMCLPDAPEAYDAKSDLFEFIRKQPVGKWDETRVLHSKIGNYISTARRYGDEWFIGSVIDQNGGQLDIVFDFLEEGVIYEITYYEDAPDTHCRNNPEAYQVRHGLVSKGDVIKAKMASGGGHCMWVKPS